MTRPTPTDLRRLIRYEPDTGRLFWRERTPKDFAGGSHPKGSRCSRWNMRYAGKEAFTATNNHNYRFGKVMGNFSTAHRVAWAIYYGEWPDKQIDHINGCRSDNRIENLRSVTNAENGRNRRQQGHNTSGHTGVYWYKRYGKWAARGKINNRPIHLGYFDEITDAIAARTEFNKQHGFTDRHGM